MTFQICGNILFFIFLCSFLAGRWENVKNSRTVCWHCSSELVLFWRGVWREGNMFPGIHSSPIKILPLLFCTSLLPDTQTGANWFCRCRCRQSPTQCQMRRFFCSLPFKISLFLHPWRRWPLLSLSLRDGRSLVIFYFLLYSSFIMTVRWSLDQFPV